MVRGVGGDQYKFTREYNCMHNCQRNQVDGMETRVRSLTIYSLVSKISISQFVLVMNSIQLRYYYSNIIIKYVRIRICNI